MTYASICPLHRGQSRLHCPMPPTFQARDGGRLTRPHSTIFASSMSIFETVTLSFALLITLGLLGWIAYTLVQNCRGYVDDKFTSTNQVRDDAQKADKAERKAAMITKRLVLGFLGLAKVGLPADRDEEGNGREVGERTRLFDNRYGYVDSRGQRSRFDGNGSEFSEYRAPVMHRVSCDGLCEAEAARRRS